MAEKTAFREKCFLRAAFPGELSEEALAVPFAADGEMLLGELRQQIDAALDTISYRERCILEMRFGLGDGYTYTLAETGYVFQITRERVRQLQSKALRKLRLRADGLRNFFHEFAK